MADHEPEHGNHSRHHDPPMNDIGKDHDTDEEQEEVEIPLEHLENFCKEKNFQKVMEILLNEEKEKYFLKLVQEGAKLPHHFNVETIVTPEEETEMSKLKKQLKIMQDQLAQMMKDKDRPVKEYTLDALCPFPFDKNLDMPPFLRGV